MSRRHDPIRLAKELIVLGLVILMVALGLTAVSCDQGLSRRAGELAFAAFACSSSPAAQISEPSAYYVVFSRLFFLWVLGGGTLATGVVLAVRARRGK